MKKNILAENMLRFGPKNLTESNRNSLKQLTEQDQSESDPLIKMKNTKGEVELDLDTLQADSTKLWSADLHYGSLMDNSSLPRS
jgi:hypothetical protein